MEASLGVSVPLGFAFISLSIYSCYYFCCSRHYECCSRRPKSQTRNEVVVLQSTAQPLPGGVIYPPGCELQQATSGLQLQQPGVHQAQPGIFQPQPAGGYFVYFPSSEQQAIGPHCDPDHPPPYPGPPQGGPGNNQEHCPKLKELSPTKDPQPSPAMHQKPSSDMPIRVHTPL
jgi:hypothetical protein